MEPSNRPAETFAERRKYERYSLRLRVSYAAHEEITGPVSESITKDLGLGGIAMIAHEPLAVGQVLRVNLNLPAIADLASDKDDCISAAAKTITLLSRVAWMRPMEGRFLVGVQFLEMDHRDVAVLKEFLEEYTLYDSNLGS